MSLSVAQQHVVCSAVRVVPRGVSRGVKKLSRTHLPDLGRYSDISEYLLRWVLMYLVCVRMYVCCMYGGGGAGGEVVWVLGS